MKIDMKVGISHIVYNNELEKKIRFLLVAYNAPLSYTEPRTEKIMIRDEPVTAAYFRSRKDMYIQQGKTYIMVHGFYD